MGLTRKDKVMILFPEAASSFFAVAMGLFCGFSWNAANYLDLDDQLGKLQKADGVFGNGTKILDLIQKAKECHLKNLRSVIFTSEPIVRSGKECIEEKTSAKVYGIYTTIEAMGSRSIAMSCINGNYHLMPELFIMETT